MNSSSADIHPAPESANRSRLRLEVIFASVLLGVGLFVLPGLIYAVGVAILGPYGENQGLGTFYANFFRDLAEPSGRSWMIALGPLAIIGLMRIAFAGVRPERPEKDDAAHQSVRRAPSEHARVEPRVGLD